MIRNSLHMFWVSYNFLLQNQTWEFKIYAFEAFHLYFKAAITLHILKVTRMQHKWG